MPKQKFWILKIGVVASCQKLGIILVKSGLKIDVIIKCQ